MTPAQQELLERVRQAALVHAQARESLDAAMRDARRICPLRPIADAAGMAVESVRRTTG